jgi:hypothetical protein
MGHDCSAGTVTELLAVIGGVVIPRIEVGILRTITAVEATAIPRVVVGMALLQRIAQPFVIQQGAADTQVLSRVTLFTVA